jgi:uncharacterized Zn finger protein
MAKKKAPARKRVTSDPPITEASVKRKADAEVFERGEGYFEDGAIIKPVRTGNTLTARCHGSGSQPYRVAVIFSKRGVVEATCSCPYEWGGYCKHIVALLLTHIRAPKSIAIKPTVKDLLADVERDDLIAMMVEMIDHYPELYGVVDGSGVEIEDDEYDDEYDEW